MSEGSSTTSWTAVRPVQTPPAITGGCQRRISSGYASDDAPEPTSDKAWLMPRSGIPVLAPRLGTDCGQRLRSTASSKIGAASAIGAQYPRLAVRDRPVAAAQDRPSRLGDRVLGLGLVLVLVSRRGVPASHSRLPKPPRVTSGRWPAAPPSAPQWHRNRPPSPLNPVPLTIRSRRAAHPH